MWSTKYLHEFIGESQIKEDQFIGSSELNVDSETYISCSSYFSEFKLRIVDRNFLHIVIIIEKGGSNDRSP